MGSSQVQCLQPPCCTTVWFTDVENEEEKCPFPYYFHNFIFSTQQAVFKTLKREKTQKHKTPSPQETGKKAQLRTATTAPPRREQSFWRGSKQNLVSNPACLQSWNLQKSDVVVSSSSSRLLIKEGSDLPQNALVRIKFSPRDCFTCSPPIAATPGRTNPTKKKTKKNRRIV